MKESKYHFKFEDFKVYQKAMDFGEVVNQQTKDFPKDERFELTSQYRRAADFIAFNLAEGSAGKDKQFLNYLGNAYHSIHECVACSAKAARRNYISQEVNEANREYLVEMAKMISSLRAIISKRISK
jgi:four helix bundle protein